MFLTFTVALGSTTSRHSRLREAFAIFDRPVWCELMMRGLALAVSIVCHRTSFGFHGTSVQHRLISHDQRAKHISACPRWQSMKVKLRSSVSASGTCLHLYCVPCGNYKPTGGCMDPRKAKEIQWPQNKQPFTAKKMGDSIRPITKGSQRTTERILN